MLLTKMSTKALMEPEDNPKLEMKRKVRIVSLKCWESNMCVICNMGNTWWSQNDHHANPIIH